MNQIKHQDPENETKEEPSPRLADDLPLSPESPQPKPVLKRGATITSQQADSSTFEDNYEHVRIVKDTEFINEFNRRPNDTEWLSFNCIQTCIKAKTIGKLIYVQFYAPLLADDKPDHKRRLAKEIEYARHHKAMPDDLVLLKSGTKKDDDLFALKQCYKMCHYIQKVYQYEILQMKAEFLKDENGNIWFYYASNIQGRSRNKKGSSEVAQQNAMNIEAGKQKVNEDEERQEMEDELQEYQQENEG